jgi:hypothetical protein
MDCFLGGVIAKGEGALVWDRKIRGSHFDQEMESFIIFLEE